MKRFFNLFRIRKEERWLATIIFLLFSALNVLMINKYFDKYSTIKDFFCDFDYNLFSVSAFDPFLYAILTNGSASHGASRHPLVAIILYVSYLINHALICLVGINCMQFIVSAILLFCVVYSFIFLYRIFREVINLSYLDAVLLTSFTFSFAYVLVVNIVPDHFPLSMFMLIFVLYISGKKMVQQQQFTKLQTVLLFIFTSGITITNGIKVLISLWFTNGKRFLRPLNFLLVAIIPFILIFIFVVCEDHRAKAKYNSKNPITYERRIYKAICDTTSQTDTSQIHKDANKILLDSESDTKKSDKTTWDNASVNRITEPIVSRFPKMKILLRWIDYSIPIDYTVIENIFGEPLILHSPYTLLGDRPARVIYSLKFNYVVEAIIVSLFVAGIWFGRRSKFLWLALSFFAFDMVLHVLIGFDVGEIYIMSPHWLFVYTIAIAYLFKVLRGRRLNLLRGLVMCLTAYLLIYNVSLIVNYLCATSVVKANFIW